MKTRFILFFLLFFSSILWSQNSNVNWNKINSLENAKSVIMNLNQKLEQEEMTQGEVSDSLKKYREAVEIHINNNEGDDSVSEFQRLEWYKILSLFAKEENEHLQKALDVFAAYLSALEKQDTSTSEKLAKIEKELSGFSDSLSTSITQIIESYHSIETGFGEYNEIISTQRKLIQDLIKQRINSSSKSTVLLGPGFSNGLNDPALEFSLGFLQHVGIFTMGGIIDFGMKSSMEMPINLGATILLGISFY